MLVLPLTAHAVVIDTFVSIVNAAQGLGWAVHPDQTDDTTAVFVEGPLTPPSGRGSLALTVPTNTDRADVFIVPKPGTGTPPPDIDAIVPTPWANLSGSFSTFTPNEALPTALPSLKVVGYQDYDDANPALSSGFTTLVLEGVYQATAPAADIWQTWTLGGPTSKVWQTNASDGFCQPAAPCTVAEFAAQYPQGAWGPIHVGLGVGPVAPTAYADNVQISDGSTTFVYDFEAPAASTATIAAGAATATGGSVSITLNASPLAVDPTVFTITFSGTSAVSPAPVTLAPGASSTLSFDLPFGTTNVVVQSRGATLASAPITFAAATTTIAPTTTLATPTTVVPGGTLPSTGSGSGGTVGIAVALVAVGSALAFGFARRRNEAR